MNQASAPAGHDAAAAHAIESHAVRPAGKKKRRAPAWTHGVGYLGVRAALTLPLAAGPRVSLSAARDIGRAFAGSKANRKRLRRAATAIGFVHPEWDGDRCTDYALRSYEHLFQLAVEVAHTPRLITPDAWVRHVEIDNITEAMRALQSDGPMVLITGHCGNWELVGYTLSMIGFPMHALYRPLDSAPLDRWLRRTRARRGLTLVDKFGAAEQLPQVIDAGDTVGFVADQNAGDRGLFVPFMGRLASTYKTIALLAIRARATVVCGWARRLNTGEYDAPVSGGFTAGVGSDSGVGSGSGKIDRGFRYRIEIPDVIRPEDWESQPDPLFYLTARYRRAIESMVRSAPDQYLWMHRIWKSRPRHERAGKPFPPGLRDKLAALPWLTQADVDAIVDRSDRDTALLAELGVDRLP